MLDLTGPPFYHPPVPTFLHLALDAARVIPPDEIESKATRAGGAGGQHVNTSSTRVEVVWNPTTSRILSDEEKLRLAHALAARLDSSGNLRVVASDTRSQRQNRELAEARLGEIVRAALVVKKKRKKTRPSRAAKEERLSEKRHASKVKRQRRDRDWDS